MNILFLFIGCLLLPLTVLGAGVPFQFAVNFSDAVSYKYKKQILGAGRYVVEVKRNGKQCDLRFIPFVQRSHKKPNAIKVPGHCGFGINKELKKGVVEVFRIEKSNTFLIYFETPYGEFDKTFYAIGHFNYSL